jgi:hypothetical protein
MPSPTNLRPPILLLGLALLLRLATVAILFQRMDRPVTYEHGEIAARLLNGEGFSVEFLGQVGPTSQQAPLYPLALAALYALFGVHSPAAILTLQLIQCLAGTLLVWVVYRLAIALFPMQPRIAWWTGLAAALFPVHIYAVTHIQVALWAALTLAALWLVCLDPVWTARRAQPLVAGLLAGLLLLIEPILVLALPVAACSLGIRCWNDSKSPQSALRAMALMTLICLLVCSPWLVRNRLVHGQWVFIKSTFGYAFWQGNNPLSWGTDKIPKSSARQIAQAHDGSLADRNRALWEARHETLYIDNVLLTPADYAAWNGLSEPARAQELGRRATDFIRAQPTRYLTLCFNRLRYFWLWDVTNPKADNVIYRTCSLATLGLALLGWIALGPAGRRASLPLLITLLVVSLFHALTITSARFRIPLEPLLLIGVGAGAATVMQNLSLVGRQIQRFFSRPLPEMHPAP